jgi:hypothetical protein
MKGLLGFQREAFGLNKIGTLPKEPLVTGRGEQGEDLATLRSDRKPVRDPFRDD